MRTLWVLSLLDSHQFNHNELYILKLQPQTPQTPDCQSHLISIFSFLSGAHKERLIFCLRLCGGASLSNHWHCWEVAKVRSIATIDEVWFDKVDADEDPTLLIAYRTGTYALNTLSWRVQSLLSVRVNNATLIASRMLRITWSVLALAALFTIALSTSPLLLRVGVRQYYVIMIIV